MTPTPPRTRLADDDGATAVEYSILAAGIGIVLVAAGPAMADAFLGLIHLITGGFSR